MVAPSIADAGVELLWTGWLQPYNGLHIDPYILWSLQTHFRQHIPSPNPQPVEIDFLVELDGPVEQGNLPWPPGLGVTVPAIYYDNLPGGTQPARHVTVRLPVGGMQLADIRTAVAELISVQRVRRAQMGFPRPPFEDDGASRPPPSDPEPQADPRVVLAVLDDACPFGHPALVSQGKTRVAALWDQSVSTEDPPTLLGYGRDRTGAELDTLLDRHTDGVEGLDEESLYLDCDALQGRLRHRSAHGAAVVPLLAGQRSVLPAHPTSADPPSTEAETVELGDDSEDRASKAPLVVVQFPREQINLTARWMVVRALDGLRYVAHEAERLKTEETGPTLPLVANLSYGGVVGAHDGTALFETAMAELAQAHQRMAIVLAAGNSHGTRRDDGGDAVDALRRQCSGLHASGLLEPNGTISLELYVPPNKPIETYLEMWFEDADKQHGDEQLLEDGEVSIEAMSPVEQPLRIDLPGIAFDDYHSNLTGAGLIGLKRVAQSRLRSMAVLVVAATQISSTRVEVPSGIWHISVTNHRTRRLRLQAWVERDLLPDGARTWQAARLLPNPGKADAAQLSDDDTLNNIATGDEVFRVGALNWRRPPPGRGVSVYSSAARNDDVGPEFSAVADESGMLPGIRVSGSIGGSMVRMNGTSVAAPQAARYIANRLARGDTLAQIRADIGHGNGDRRIGRILV